MLKYRPDFFLPDNNWETWAQRSSPVNQYYFWRQKLKNKFHLINFHRICWYSDLDTWKSIPNYWQADIHRCDFVGGTISLENKIYLENQYLKERKKLLFTDHSYSEVRFAPNFVSSTSGSYSKKKLDLDFAIYEFW